MGYVVLDLEWNGAYVKVKKEYFNEIIEFGAVKLDDNLNVVDTFSALIKPVYCKKINKRIEDLTHITTEQLQKSTLSYKPVMDSFIDFLGDNTLLTWGTSDILVLIENYKSYYNKEYLDFVSQYCDAQIFCEKALNMYDPGKQMGLSTCAQELNINVDDIPLHRAYNDAELTAQCVKKLFNRANINDSIKLADRAFYEKLTFKTVYITDIENKLVDKSKMNFACPSCKKPLKRKGKWVSKNRSFRSDCTCPKCKKEYIGKVTWRIKYEGVEMIKKLVPKPKEEKKDQTTDKNLKENPKE